MKNPYNEKYFKRHFEQYRDWEKQVGKIFLDTLKFRSIVDLGCGVGSYLEGMLETGFTNIQGVDSSFENIKPFITEKLKPYISFADITEDLYLNLSPVECVMSIEVAEHLSPDKTTSFLTNIGMLAYSFVILSAAPPGQPGTGHINCRPKEFWISSLNYRKFNLNFDYTEKIKSQISTIAPKYILNNLLIFERSL